MDLSYKTCHILQIPNQFFCHRRILYTFDFLRYLWLRLIYQLTVIKGLLIVIEYKVQGVSSLFYMILEA